MRNDDFDEDILDDSDEEPTTNGINHHESTDFNTNH